MDDYAVDQSIIKKENGESEFSFLFKQGDAKRCDTIENARRSGKIPIKVDFRVTVRGGGIVWFWLNEEGQERIAKEKKSKRKKTFYIVLTGTCAVIIFTALAFAI